MKITTEQLESLQHMQRATKYIIGHIERGVELDPHETAWASRLLACAEGLDADPVAPDDRVHVLPAITGG